MCVPPNEVYARITYSYLRIESSDFPSYCDTHTIIIELFYGFSNKYTF